MRLLILFLILSASPLSAQSSANSPLTDEELRLIHGYLLEVKPCREEVRKYESYVARDLEMDAREKAVHEQELKTKDDAIALANERAKFYEDAYRLLLKKPGGFKCVVAKIFTLGIYRCK